MINDHNIPKALKKDQSALFMLYEIGNAMRSTMRLDEILYIILTSVTAQAGLGFNRAMLFLVNEKTNMLEGRMGVGPDSGEQANKIWNYLENEQTSLDELFESYQDFAKKTDSHLDNLVKKISLPIDETSGVLAQTVLGKKPITVLSDNEKTAIKKNDPAISLFNMNYFVTVPLLAKDSVVGVMLVDNFYSKQTITKGDIWKLIMFANQAGLAIENSQEFERTLILSNTDRLTGLWNYGYFQHQLKEEIKRAARFNRNISLLMADIDFFKQFNDNYGHLAGDKLLKDIANVLKKSCREVDLVSRYGGEEFAIILPETFKEKAYNSAERIRKHISTTYFYDQETKTRRKCSISIGVASFPQDAQEKNSLISSADKALYAAKDFGRNRVCMFSNELS